MLLPLALPEITMTAEDEFWALKDKARERGISRSMMGRLAKYSADYDKALHILNSAFQTMEPIKYIGAVINRLKKERIPAHFAAPSLAPIVQEPEVVTHARLRGWPVRKSRRTNGEDCWWVAGVMYDGHGIDVGG